MQFFSLLDVVIGTQRIFIAPIGIPKDWSTTKMQLKINNNTFEFIFSLHFDYPTQYQ